MEQAIKKSNRLFASPYIYAILSATSIVLVGFFSGYLTLSGIQEIISPVDESNGSSFFEILSQIFSKNFLVFLVLISGVISYGLSSLLAGFTVGIYVGTTFALSKSAIGLPQLIGNVWPYFFFEMAAFLIAILAGIVPAAASLKKSEQAKDMWKTYASAVPLSARLAGSGLALLIVAAVIETLVILQRK